MMYGTIAGGFKRGEMMIMMAGKNTGVSKLWLNEPNYFKWTDQLTGYKCMIRRVQMTGALVGYVRVPHGHKLFRLTYLRKLERRIEVHGGLTFSGRPTRYAGGHLRGHWFGFDCAHHMDLMPNLPSFGGGVYRDFNYVKAEVESMAKQLKEMSK